MNKLKSHFEFSRKQRNGIFLLFVLIIVAQSLYFFVDVSPKDISINQNHWESFQKEVDSLALIAMERRKPKLYPFNPNYITDYKGYSLGMSNDAIDRLHQFRAQNKWVNSAKQFQSVTKISDSLLKSIAPYFKFPDWVMHPKSQSTLKEGDKIALKKSFEFKKDLNTATKSQLQSINGIGKKLSARIIKLRNSFKDGFIADVQLLDVYGLTPEVIERLSNNFTVKTPRQVHKFNLNTVAIEELVTIQHIDYELAYEIIEQRTLRDGFTSFEELIKVKDFPVHKIEIIKLYLKLN